MCGSELHFRTRMVAGVCVRPPSWPGRWPTTRPGCAGRLATAIGLDFAAAARVRGKTVNFEGAVMSKGMNQKKDTKKQPVKTAKEKKAAKQEKKAAK